jgi:hypothetical protein
MSYDLQSVDLVREGIRSLQIKQAVLSIVVV